MAREPSRGAAGTFPRGRERWTRRAGRFPPRTSPGPDAPRGWSAAPASLRGSLRPGRPFPKRPSVQPARRAPGQCCTIARGAGSSTRFRTRLTERPGSAVMEAGESPPRKEPIMRVLRKAAVLVLLGLSLGTSGVFAAQAQSEGPRHPAKVVTPGASYIAPVWHRFVGLWLKAGCTINPLGQCHSIPGTQSQSDSGCGIDPLGRCSSGH
jgi:hypothetical protein